MSTICYLNGTYCDETEAKVSIFDRAFLFGDAIYEGLRINHGRVFRVPDHYVRMTDALKALGIPLPFSLEEYGKVCAELAKRNKLNAGLVYIQVTRGEAMRSHVPPKGLRPTVIGFAHDTDIPAWRKFPEGVATVTVEDTRWTRCHLKTTMLLANALAKQQASDAGAFEAILVSKDSIVHEGGSANVFAIIGGTIRTHPADNHVLPGITRKIVLELARTNGIPVAEDPFTMAHLLAAEEAFLTSTTADVCPVIRVNGKPIGNGRIGPITRRLMTLLAETIEAETR